MICRMGEVAAHACTEDQAFLRSRLGSRRAPLIVDVFVQPVADCRDPLMTGLDLSELTLGKS